MHTRAVLLSIINPCLCMFLFFYMCANCLYQWYTCTDNCCIKAIIPLRMSFTVMWVFWKECPLRYQLTLPKSKFAQKNNNIISACSFDKHSTEVQAMTSQNKKKHKSIISMLALLLQFTSKCKNYCRIIVDYALSGIVIQHLVHLHNHIYVIKALKTQS